MQDIVKEIQIGETKISINDSYCKDKTDEEVKRVLESIVERTMGYFQTKTA